MNLHKNRSGTWASLLLMALLLAFVSALAAASSYPRTDMTNIGGGKVGLFAPCALQLGVRGGTSRRVHPGRAVKISFKLQNTGAAPVEEAAVTVRLPPLVTYRSGYVSRRTGPVVFDPTTNIVTWPSLSVKGRGSLLLSVSVITVSECVPTAPLEILIRTEGGRQAFCPVQATVSLTIVSSKKRPRPTCPPTTAFPTPAPTVACVPGEFRNATGQCQPCVPGTFWNETTQTTACLPCPAGQDSLLGATRCFTPCPPNTSLNTTDLTCVPIPQAALDELANLGIDPSLVNDSFVVEEEAALADTIGYLYTLPSGSLVVITIGPGVFPVVPTDLDVDLIIVGSGRRRLLETEESGDKGDKLWEAEI